MSDETQNAIAIIGMAGRFPGASSIEELWQNLRDGVESVTRFDLDEIDPSVPDVLLRDKNYVPVRGVIAGAELCDADFFRFAPRECEVMDPQHRVLLEMAWCALESAGYAPGPEHVVTGVFVGASPNSYLENNLLQRPDVIKSYGRFQVGLANERDFLATRISNKLDLRGPSFTISTACSTSLVAVTLAAQSLQNFDCDMAIAGGVSIVFPQKQGYLFQEGGIASPDGHCRPFDRHSQGTYGGDGAGIVVLKRLEDAVASNDEIIAVIRGAAINNDGSDKVGFTAPSVSGQAGTIAMAQALAGVDPESISYIEAHGTATPMGDPIEIEALKKVFGRGPEKTCAIGSVKSNFGHLDAAAGVTGLIKTALALQHKTIPPSLNFSEENPNIDFQNSPFYVNDQCAEWKRSQNPRRAGVSSFGMGGTNAHVVLEEAPERASSPGEFVGRPLLLLSARSENALDTLSQALHQKFSAEGDTDLKRIAYTYQARRPQYPHRRYLVCENTEEVLNLLGTPNPAVCGSSSNTPSDGSVVMMFPGQGCQYVGMGHSLYTRDPRIRDIIDSCSQIAEPIIGESLVDALYPSSSDTEAAAEKLRNTLYTQPTLFALEYALARLWMSCGVEPTAFIGHSIGEFVAATLAGVFTFEDAVRLVSHRARLMQSTAPGSMLSVRLPEDELRQHLVAGTELAAVNSESLCVAAGDETAIAELSALLTNDEVIFSQVQTSHAFHCALMDPIVEEFREIVAATPRSAARLPFISCTTGRWVNDEETGDPTYWARHLREPVRFADGIKTLLENHRGVYLECGPRRTLGTLTRQIAGRDPVSVVCSLDSDGDALKEDTALSKAMGDIWCAGQELVWDAFYVGDVPRVTCCPNTPFDYKSFLISPPAHEKEGGHDLIAESGIQQSSNREREYMVATSQVHEIESSAAAAAGGREAKLQDDVCLLVAELSGLEPADLDTGSTFLEQGMDSLLLTQLALSLKAKFEVDISFRDLMEELISVDDVVSRLDREVPNTGVYADVPTAPAGTSADLHMSNAATTTISHGATNSGYANASQLIEQQMQLMRQQIELLDRLSHNGAIQSSLPNSVSIPAARPQSQAQESRDAPLSAKEWAGFGPSVKIDRKKSDTAVAHDAEAFQSLVDRYTEKTRRSRDWVQEHRREMSDPRTASGFRRDTKELVYPIVAAKSNGSRLWDIDGNEYIDLTNGFGSVLLGHANESVAEALRNQIDHGWEFGPQTVLAGEVARLVTELTGHERVAFCNTGSEAVLAAIRMARTVTGKDTIAVFSGSYHGIFDEVVVRPLRDGVAVPAAPGIPRSATENVLVLEYGSDESIAVLQRNSDRLAAVLVEPVQSRRPEHQPWEFLRTLRTFADDSGVALVFDEIVSGFRAHPAGVQGLIGVQADLATYGKTAGGGLPLGLVAGTSKFMDALDGGTWQFGDDSFPETGVTMFAGTFIRHPLALAAAKATLTVIRDEGPALQQRMNSKTERLAEALNAIFVNAAVPCKVNHFSSWFIVNMESTSPYATLLFQLLREHGIHIWDQRPCFLTDAHTEADVDAIISAFKEALTQMIAARFIEQDENPAATAEGSNGASEQDSKSDTQPPVAGARLGRTPEGNPAWFVADPDQAGKYRQIDVDV